MKDYAIIVGHTSDSKGACSEHGIPCEWDYNNMIAAMLSDIADVYNHGSYKKGYTAMVKETAARVNAKNYKVVLCLHYNSAGPTATGCEVLYYGKSVKGGDYAKQLSALISTKMGMRNRGAKPLAGTNDRGYGEVFYPKATALLVEPFFGSNPADVAKFKAPMACSYGQVLREFLLSIK